TQYVPPYPTRRSSDLHCLLPDRPRVGHFEHSRARVKKLCQIREINMRPQMISSEIVYGIKRSKINLSGDSLSGFDFQRWLRVFRSEEHTSELQSPDHL